jgi:hypothetical protein
MIKKNKPCDEYYNTELYECQQPDFIVSYKKYVATFILSFAERFFQRNYIIKDHW